MRKGALALLVLGIGVLCYPWASRLVNSRSTAAAMEIFHQSLMQTDMVLQRSLAESYNARLLRSETAEGEYEEILNIWGGIMGRLNIPKIQVSLPIYHGIDEEVLRKGAGHLPGSAFPIGGKGNHAVLTGHTGLPGAYLLTDLRKLETGDTFRIDILGESLTYQVDSIRVVLPEEAEALTPIPDEDLCTLVTCTPYGINSHRLLVRGKRVEE